MKHLIPRRGRLILGVYRGKGLGSRGLNPTYTTATNVEMA